MRATVSEDGEDLGGSWTTLEPVLPPPPMVLAPAANAAGEAELDGEYFGGSTVTPLEPLLLPPGPPPPLFPDEEVPGPAHSRGDMVVVVVAEVEPAGAASPGP